MNANVKAIRVGAGWAPNRVVGALTIAVVVASFVACRKPAPVNQPMAFSHRRHMEADMKCISCHPGAEDQRLAQFPLVSDCMDCHGKARGNHPDEPKVRLFAQSRQEVPWIRVDRLPGHVNFSHATHVTLAKMKCEDCHQGILAATQPLALPDIHLKMEDCMQCHRERKASNQCAVCHQ